MIGGTSGFYNFKIFSPYPKVLNVVTTKKSGNFLPLKNGDNSPLQVLSNFGVALANTVRAKQTHSSNVAVVGPSEAGKAIPNVDALFTDRKNIFLLVLVADCVPLLFYDPVKNFVVCAHSGWQGALQKIAVRVVEECLKKGSNVEDILVGAGPSVCVDHYPVPASRAQLFDIAFDQGAVTSPQGQSIHLDLKKAVKNSLLQAGIVEKHMEFSTLCTAENSDQFYSYRGEGGLKGEFAAIIGLKD